MLPQLSEEEKQYLADKKAMEDAIAAQRAAQAENMRERMRLYLLCEANPEEQAAEFLLCSRDPIYFIEKYVYTFDPRENPEHQTMPFVLYAFQKKFILWLVENINATVGTVLKRNLLIEKSRAVGASWMLCAVAAWYFLFHHSSSHFGSRIEDLADKLGDMNSLLEKIRFILRNLPEWMLPDGFRDPDHLGNKLLRQSDASGGAQISAEAASPHFGRGGRKLFVVMDELASWEKDDASVKAASGSTNVMIFISTPFGVFNKFARMARGEDKIEVSVYRIHWSEHPIMAAGLRTDAEGKLTSFWYEQEKRRLSPEDLASEVDIAYETSTKGLVFSEFGDLHRARNLKPSDKSHIIRVWDPGVRGFGVLWMEVDNYNHVKVFDELCGEHARIWDVADTVKRISNERFRGFYFDDIGDPAGATRNNSSQEDAEYTILREQFDIEVEYDFMLEIPSPMRVKHRITAIHDRLRALTPTGKPSLQIDVDRCPILNRALAEGYRYKVRKETKQILEVVDERHPFEDVVDCLGMGLLYKLGVSATKRGTTSVTVDNNVVEWQRYSRRAR